MNAKKIPRPEYPRPQFVREQWMNLNGTWSFEIDSGLSGMDQAWYDKESFSSKITVPFCPESELSGIGYKDFMPAVWYAKRIVLEKSSLHRLILHFGACDYETCVWVNRKRVGTHKGGYTSFCFDITDQVVTGENVIVVYAKDDVRSGGQPAGKQSTKYHSHACSYTRTTGIWQTVWIESVPDRRLDRISVVPDIDNQCIHLDGVLQGEIANLRVNIRATYEEKLVGEKAISVGGSAFSCSLVLDELFLWEPGCGRLYDLQLELMEDERIVDRVSSYFGMRSVSIENNVICINHQPVFQRLVLDQGFYPDGIYTAPTDEDLQKDIHLAMQAGFNGARLHEKIFEPRFLYHADKMGYLVWEEHANWGLDIQSAQGFYAFLPEWMEAMERDKNHPCIVGWCPFNETVDHQDPDIIKYVYEITKRFDPTRPVIDTSGYVHVKTDVFDVHDYTQDPKEFEKHYEPLNHGDIKGAFSNRPEEFPYQGGPYFVSEFGGTWWNPSKESNGNDRRQSWGYGQKPASLSEFYERYEKLVSCLLQNKGICAFCYTQLTDVEQEQNGLYAYDRSHKFDIGKIRDINRRQAAIEK